MTLRWIPKSRCNVDVKLTQSGNTRSEQLLVVPTESLINRDWPERERRLVFRYEISDLLPFRPFNF